MHWVIGELQVVQMVVVPLVMSMARVPHVMDRVTLVIAMVSGRWQC